MLDLSIIILTYNEEIHIERCIDSVKDIAQSIYVVDSFSTDRTIELAVAKGAKIFQNKWENNHAKQFNWGLDHLPIDTKWVLRLDADEYLSNELKSEIIEKLPNLADHISGVELLLRRVFMGRWIKHGCKKIYLLRLFRYKQARCENRWMDEHIEVLEGNVVRFQFDFADDNLNDLSWWTNKHVGYANREAIELLNFEYEWIDKTDSKSGLGKSASKKRIQKNRYAKMPLFVRPFIYFCYRYFILLGFVDGKEGFLWHFLQGWWYRTLVDAKVLEVKRAHKGDAKKIKNYIANYLSEEKNNPKE